MSKDEITGETIYNLEVRFINKDKSKVFKHPHRIKFYENDGCSADIIMPDIWFEHKDLDKYVSDLEAKLAEKEKEIEKLTEQLDYKNFWNDFVDLYTGNKLKTQMLHENCKDKISFAVEQLTLFKNSIVNKMNNPYSVNIKHILSDFDNQIKQLKEGMKNE